MDLHLSKSRGSFSSAASTTLTSNMASSTISRPQSQQEVPLTSNGQSYELIKSTQVRNIYFLRHIEAYLKVILKKFVQNQNLLFSAK